MLPCLFNHVHSFFPVDKEKPPKLSPTLKFLSENAPSEGSPKEWLIYKKYQNTEHLFLGFECNLMEEMSESWQELCDEIKQKVFTPLKKEFTTLEKKFEDCDYKESIAFIARPHRVGIFLEKAPEERPLYAEERCQLTFVRTAIERLLAVQSDYGITKEEVNKKLHKANVDINKYFDVKEEMKIKDH